MKVLGDVLMVILLLDGFMNVERELVKVLKGWLVLVVGLLLFVLIS